MASVTFGSPLDALQAIVRLVFEWGDAEDESWQAFCPKRASQKQLPAWDRYLKDTVSPLWGQFSSERRSQAFKELEGFFSSVIDGPSRDLNERFFSGYETQGAKPLANDRGDGFLRVFRSKIGVPSWVEVIRILGGFLAADQIHAPYDRTFAGSANSPFYEALSSTNPNGAVMLEALHEAPIDGRTQWMTLWRMLRACAFLTQSAGGDFAAFLEKSGIIDRLGVELTPDLARDELMKKWREREKFLEKVIKGKMPGIARNTFEYILRDLQYPGCLSLFKLDSTNIKLFSLLFGEDVVKNPDRLLESLLEMGIVNEFPLAIINMAAYAFTTKSHLNMLGCLKPTGEGFELLVE